MRDDWDFLRVQAWDEFTANHPPLAPMVAAYLGYKPRQGPTSDRLEGDAAVEYLMSMPGFVHK